MKDSKRHGIKVKNNNYKKIENFNKIVITKILLLILFSMALSISIMWRKDLSIETVIGTSLLIAILLILLYKDLMRYRPTIYRNYSIMLLIGILLLGNILMGLGSYYILESSTIWLGDIDPQLPIYAIPLATGSMLAALLIDIHTAIVFSVITSLLAGIWQGEPLYSIFSFISGLTAAFGVIRCKKRSAIWRAGLFMGLVCVLASLMVIFIQGQIFTINTPVVMGFAFFNGLMVATLVSAILPLLEYSFNLSTDISLLELLDLNQPLMRNLLIAAPGTYHHSIIVGNLVESAAEAVGVNPLLARVSAFYHDIGKTKMPEYFIENQSRPVSMHEKLTPQMSGLIIISHVKEGVELAKQHKLPDSIIDIIQQHHGTSVVAFFYQKAKDRQENGVSPLVEEANFRYPGPKPKTRVAALVLMADAVEAASRALTEPIPTRISALVDRIVNHFFLDGQLDDCELTLRDLREIKSHFVYLLTSMFHRRVDYPGFETKDENSDKKPAKPEAV
ncbi:MAG: HDIG domain-containing metalloprotein [Nitrospirota bacterium]